MFYPLIIPDIFQTMRNKKYYFCPKCFALCNSVEQRAIHMQTNPNCNFGVCRLKPKNEAKNNAEIIENQLLQTFFIYCSGRSEKLHFINQYLEQLDIQELKVYKYRDKMIYVFYKHFIQKQLEIEEQVQIYRETFTKNGFACKIPSTQS